MTLRPFLVALFALTLSGCGLELAFGGVENTCFDSSVCGGGTCVDHRCITPELEAPMRVAFEVVSVRDASQPIAAPSLFEPIALDGATSQDLMLREQITVSGGAFFGSNRLRVPAQVTFTPRPSFEGAPTASVRVTSDVADYAVVLDAGRVYDVLVEPTASLVNALVAGITAEVDPPANDVFPPLYIDGVTSESFGDGALDFSYPDSLFEPCGAPPSAACTQTGVVVSVDADGSEQPEAGLRVRAIDATGRSVSSSVLTGLDGSYALRLLPGTGDVSLRVSPVSELSTLPVGVFPLATTVSGADNVVRLPRLATAILEAVVGYEPTPAAGDISFLDGAAVSFESVSLDALGLEGALSFRRSVTTASTDLGSGRFAVELLPGTYRVVVTPSDRDLASVLVTELTIDPRAAGTRIMGQYYRVPLRALVEGSVLKPDRSPLSFATVHALRVSPEDTLDPMDIRRFARASRAVSDAQGIFALPLDVGVYDLLVLTWAGSGFAWELFADVTVSEVGVTLARDLVFAAPVPVEGVVHGAEGEPLALATVRAHVVIESDDGVRSRQVAEATTDAAGRYELLLPAVLAP